MVDKSGESRAELKRTPKMGRMGDTGDKEKKSPHKRRLSKDCGQEKGVRARKRFGIDSREGSTPGERR